MNKEWDNVRRAFDIPDNTSTRLAFQAGARHVLTVLTDFINDAEEAERAFFALNDEILAFAKRAISEGEDQQ